MHIFMFILIVSTAPVSCGLLTHFRLQDLLLDLTISYFNISSILNLIATGKSLCLQKSPTFDHLAILMSNIIPMYGGNITE